MAVSYGRHGHDHEHGHQPEGHHQSARGHRHGLVGDDIKRSREGIRAVACSLAVLGVAAGAQAVVFAVTGSVALLADLVHNAGDALTAVPLALAFTLRSARAERGAGVAVVIAIFISACVAAAASIDRFVHARPPGHLLALAIAGAIGYVGNATAAHIRTKVGEQLHSPALIADGHHARADAYVSLAVIGSALFVAIGAPVADPLLGLAITAVILRITWESWRTLHSNAPGR